MRYRRRYHQIPADQDERGGVAGFHATHVNKPAPPDPFTPGPFIHKSLGTNRPRRCSRRARPRAEVGTRISSEAASRRLKSFVSFRKSCCDLAVPSSERRSLIFQRVSDGGQGVKSSTRHEDFQKNCPIHSFNGPSSRDLGRAVLARSGRMAR
jgi:hypothetical protein